MPAAARPRAAPTLARHYLRWLAALATVLVLTVSACALVFVMWPMARRSAEDLAALMVLSAQTWAELPPESRAAFVDELEDAHRLLVQPGAPAAAAAHEVHGFYIGFLEEALVRRLGATAAPVAAPGPDGSRWLWVAVPTGEGLLRVGFDPQRLDTRPLQALAAVLLVSAVLTAAAAAWLARRIAQPVARLEQAAAALAAGATPQPLPESGPRELAQLAGHFNHMAAQVHELLDARTTLLAGVSHDLRTPLARMRLALEMLTLQPQPRLIAQLESDIEVMNRLIGQMLELARGLDTEAVQPLDLAAWLAARVQAQQALAQQQGAHLHLDARALAGRAPVPAAPQALARVLDNYLGNALRYAGGDIEVQAGPAPEAGWLRVAVLDRGPGLTEAQIAQAWRPFQRGEASRSPHTGGVGLGLAIVRQLARARGWRVGLQPREGGGLVAWVELPAPPAPPA